MTPLEMCRLIQSTADSAAETNHSPAEVIASNWDILGPKLTETIQENPT